MIYNYSQTSKFPAQKVPTKQKTEEWFKKCIDAAENIYLYGNEEVTKRSTLKQKEECQDLYDGILSQDHMAKVVNPWNLKTDSFPSTMRHYPIARNKINLLVGEESKRKQPFTVIVTNDSAVSQKEEMIQQKINDFLIKNANPIITPEWDKVEFERQLKKLDHWKKYEAQDIRERRATQILQHDSLEQKFDLKFNQCFKNALIQREAIACIDIYGNKPVLRVCDPRNIVVWGLGDSNRIEDADGIIEIGYFPTGRIVDQYYDDLTSDQIDEFEGNRNTSGGKSMINYDEGSTSFPSQFFDTSSGIISKYFNSETDEYGNIRVMRVTWKSRRELQIVTGFDENGNEYEVIKDENYKIDKSKGEKSKKIWVNEWMEGTKIKNLYVKMQPRPIQSRKMDNPSICGSGYVGTIYPASLMELMAPYNYMYNILAYRVDKAIAKYKGPMLEVDLAKIPDGWELDKWFYYGEEMSYIFVDSFKEGQKGQATGKLAGSIANTSGKVYNPDMANYIIQNIELMKYVQNQLGDVVGITPQREGAISSRETFGGIERAVTQSNNSTEEWFLLHDDFKLRVYEAYLDTAKYCYRDYKNKKMQYISDELSQSIYKIDGDDFSDADYGIVVTSSSSALEVKNALKGLTQAGIQNQILNFSQVMDIYTNPSLAETRRKIEAAETEKIEREDLRHKEEMETQKIVSQNQLETVKGQLELKKYEIDEKNKTAIQVAEISTSNNLEKLERQHDIDIQKMNNDKEMNNSQLALNEKKDNQQVAIKKEELKEKERKNKKDEAIKQQSVIKKSKG